MQQLADIFAKFKQQLPQRNQRSEICSINLVREGLVFVQITWDAQKKPELKFCEFIPISFDPDKIQQTLASIVKKNNFQGFPCNWVLQTKDYELVSIPNLPVPAQELLSALRWHVKDQISFPAAEAAIDYFKVPCLSKTQKDELIYVIVARKNYLELMSKVIVESGLSLNVIEIPEFAVRNVAELFADKNAGIGIIEIHPLGVRFTIMQDGFVFLVRRVDITLPQVPQETDDISVLVTEVQRSCDYYENGLGQSPVAKFLLISPDPALATRLTTELGIPVEFLDLTTKLAVPEAMKPKFQHCLYAVGGALRQETADNETAS